MNSDSLSLYQFLAKLCKVFDKCESRVYSAVKRLDQFEARGYYQKGKDTKILPHTQILTSQFYHARGVRNIKGGKILIRLRKVKCGKGCDKCPHGYYVYAHWKEHGKDREKYFGKLDEPATNTAVKKFAQQHPRIWPEWVKIRDADQLKLF